MGATTDKLKKIPWGARDSDYSDPDTGKMSWKNTKKQYKKDPVKTFIRQAITPGLYSVYLGQKRKRSDKKTKKED